MPTCPTTRAAAASLLVFGGWVGTAHGSQCEPWCSEPCTALNGNVQIECGGCDARMGCHPGAEGYSSWEERNQAFHGEREEDAESAIGALAPGCSTLRCKRVRERRALEAREAREAADVAAFPAANPPSSGTVKPPPAPPPAPPPRAKRPPPPPPTPPKPPASTTAAGAPRGPPLPGLGARHDGRTAGGVDVPCELQRFAWADLRARNPAERASLLQEPAIITGLVDDWPAFESWGSPRNFSARFGHHRLLAKRTAFGWQGAERAGVSIDRSDTSLADLVQRTRHEHVIVLDEFGASEAEDALLTDLLTDFSPPEIFESASACRVFSFGGGHRGVQMMQHGVAWLALVTGAKLWHVAPPHLPRPSDRQCDDGGRVDYALAQREGVRHCLLLPRETIFVPTNWWHATCNLDPYTIGVGGQLWRPGMEGLFEMDAERTRPVVRQPSYPRETLVRATPLPDVPAAIIFDPDADESDDEMGSRLGTDAGAAERVVVSAAGGVSG